MQHDMSPRGTKPRGRVAWNVRRTGKCISSSLWEREALRAGLELIHFPSRRPPGTNHPEDGSEPNRCRTRKQVI